MKKKYRNQLEEDKEQVEEKGGAGREESSVGEREQVEVEGDREVEGEKVDEEA